MSGKIFEFTNTYGVLNGIKLYLKQKYNKPADVNAPFLRHPVHFRGQRTKSDLLIFQQIFCAKDYNIIVPVDPQIIFDLGANAGFASVYFANRFPDSKIVALEPDTENYEAARKNVSKYDKIQLIQGAVWNRCEEIHLEDKGFGEAAFMIEPGTGANVVKAFTIKSLMDLVKASTIDILKIDIEGSEKEIFEYGYEEWLPLTKIIIVETHDRYKRGASKSVLSAVSKYNFSLELSGENLVFYNMDVIDPY